MSDSNDDVRLSLRPDVAWRLVAGEAFLVTPDRAMHRVAAPSGVAILEALRGAGQTRQTLLQHLEERFVVEPSTLAGDVDAFLAALAAAGILERAARAHAAEPTP